MEQVEHLLIVIQFGSLVHSLSSLHGHLVLFVHLNLCLHLLNMQLLRCDFAICDLLILLLFHLLEIDFFLEIMSCKFATESLFLGDVSRHMNSILLEVAKCILMRRL